jgi:hypothetical protein
MFEKIQTDRHVAFVIQRERKYTVTCKVWCSYFGVAEDSSVLRYYAVLIGK